MTYEYECKKCGHQWEDDQKITEPPVKICPVCGEESAKRLISGGTGFSLLGSGWYKKGGY